MDYIGQTQSAPLLGDEEENSIEWVDLAVLGSSGGGIGENMGTVEFRARFRHEGRLQVLHEISNFHRENRGWLYVGGIIKPQEDEMPAGKVGRNAPCPCG